MKRWRGRCEDFGGRHGGFVVMLDDRSDARRTIGSLDCACVSQGSEEGGSAATKKEKYLDRDTTDKFMRKHVWNHPDRGQTSDVVRNAGVLFDVIYELVLEMRGNAKVLSKRLTKKNYRV